MKEPFLREFVALTILGFFTSTAYGARELSLDERVAAQTAVERVYWRHRIWPQDNPGPKPPLERGMTERAIRAKVETYLRESNALEKFWNRPIDAEQLQAEMERMGKETRDPAMLREIFDALGNDPFLIAECLARPTLADRMVRTYYATDERIHGNLERAGGEAEETPEAWLSRNDSALGIEVAVPIGPYREVSIRESECADDTWSPGPDSLGARISHTAVWTGSEMIVWGGFVPYPTNYESTGGRYNPATHSWAAVSLNGAPSPRSCHTAVWTGSEMIVWGGEGSTNTNTGGRYDPATNSWSSTALTGAPSARSLHTAVWTGTKMIVWGGGSPGGQQMAGAQYDPSNDSWFATSLTGAPSPRDLHTAVWTGSRMVIWGGVDRSTVPGSGLSTGGRYDPIANTWTPTSNTGAPSARYRHTAVWTGTDVLVWGGVNSSPSTTCFNTGGRYDPVADAWIATSTTGAPSARYAHTAVWTGSTMIVWGGTCGSPVQSGSIYDPASDSWTSTPTVNAPAARLWHTAVWTGSEMIVWGGRLTPTGTPLGDGGRFSPATGTWVPTETYPAPRSRHGVAWTGAEMIVWGGLNQRTGLLNDGGRYDPALNHWSAMSTAGGPGAVEYSTMVWTGTEAIVWGGRDSAGPTSLGARYNPASDSWTATNGADAPSARYLHSAVWTGRKMIVWGGASAFNTGGQYDPVTNSWSPTSPTGAPSARYFHTAIWTGSRMIVWGGGLSTGTNTGGRYDPLGDSWTPTSTIGAPSARTQSTAVWTGSELVVWGGTNGFGLQFDTGGRYSPQSDTWSATTVVGAPSGRQDHSAVWSGERMIVWGGSVDSLPSDTGARYDPASDSWSPTSTSEVPLARAAHTAVWTGSQMIVWGGGVAGGGRYCSACQTTSTFYRDDDGDGHGLSAFPLTTCGTTPPPGYGSLVGDCDDANRAVYPGAPQPCDGVNNDCNDPSWPAPPANETDTDGDGFRGCAGDCDDSSANVHPGAAEVCNGMDDNCNGQTDEDAQGVDSDGDGVHNACDNCGFDFNASQSDTNDDGEGDVCDLNDGLIWEFREDKSSLSWQPEQGPTSWNVYIGDLAVLKSTGVYTQPPGSNPLADRHCGETQTFAADLGVPVTHTVSFSLVTGVQGGVEGALGSSSSGTRPNANPCP